MFCIMQKHLQIQKVIEPSQQVDPMEVFHKILGTFWTTELVPHHQVSSRCGSEIVLSLTVANVALKCLMGLLILLVIDWLIDVIFH